MPEVAFIGHMPSARRYHDLLCAARGPDLPAPPLEDFERMVRAMAPMPISDFWFESTTGRQVVGRYIDIFFLVDEPLAVKAGLSRVRAACDEARACGARIAALGGFSSILGEMSGGGASAAHGLALTTGNTLTAAVLAAQVQVAAHGDIAVTVVGAGGDVGSGLCRILAAQGRQLVLVGRNPRPLEELESELPRARACGWDEAARTAELVVTVASTPPGAIGLDALPSGATVLDAGHPSNAAPAAHVRYAPAGKVRHARTPRTDLPVVLADCAHGETHACLAEALVLAYEERFEPYSRGRGGVHPPAAAAILALAERHGVVPAPLHFAAPTLPT
jgi:fatty aldehyde-generating acyl-ACP reductase